MKGDIAVVEGVTTYQMADENLEDLEDAQRDLLRMGPQNIRKVQNKLREMAMALGVPENQLPKPQGIRNAALNSCIRPGKTKSVYFNHSFQFPEPIRIRCEFL